jgi:hypothetical protein
MSDALIIRPVVPTDFAGGNDYGTIIFTVARCDHAPRCDYEDDLVRFFDAYEPVHAIVAERDGQLLGLVHYIFHRSTIMIESTCYLQDLFTAESARG